MKDATDKKLSKDMEFWADVMLDVLFFIGALGWISLGIWQTFNN